MNSVVRKSANPFSMSPDPHLFYFSRQHVECLQLLESTIRLKSGLNVVLGDVGTGKTTLGRILIRLFKDKPEYIFRMILDPKFTSEDEFLSHLLQLFEVKTEATSCLGRKDALENFLYFKGVRERRIPVLIIDEGQKLTSAMMEIIRSLLNYETNEFKLIQVVILAQLELAAQIRQMPNFMDRIAGSYVLQPMDQEDLMRMIGYRLKKCGYDDLHGVFTKDALLKIYDHSRGFPRKAINLCYHAMMVKMNDQLDVIGEDVVTYNIRRKEVTYV